DEAFLSRLSPDGEMSISLVLPGEEVTGAGPAGGGQGGARIIRGLDLPFVDIGAEGRPQTATFSVSHGFAGLEDILRGVDRWFLVAVAAAVLLSIALVSSIASRISRPLAALSRKTREVDLDRLDVDFPAGGDDEIGALSSLLGEMVERLRAGAARIRDAEHRATHGEMARQVNHDIKNGLTPIRNVFRHLGQLSREAPEQLPGVFSEREGTVESSIGYLERLASNYARLYPSGERVGVDLDEVVRRVAGDRAGTPSVEVELDLCGRASVVADPLSMRRLVENLSGNAFESLGEAGGRVSFRTRAREEAGGQLSVELEVEDDGCGIAEEKLGRIFDDFYTTREDGTGLGLSIVRRLVMDLGGEIVVDSEEGRGSVFTVRLPGDRTAGDTGEG
ncbi:MAG TPA: ATP-binding protein, partial [Candidatus Krumholzibacterium sp.]|nr:ATP-binding protein [Candidatus Krumholzibacterium sp.]